METSTSRKVPWREANRSITEPAWPDVPDASSSWLDSTVVLEPFAHGWGGKETEYYTLVSWEEDKDLAMRLRAAGVGFAPGDSTASYSVGGANGVAGDAEQSPPDERGGQDKVKALGLLDPPDRSVVIKRDQIEVTARVPLGSKYELFSGDELVPADRIGKKEIHLDERFEEITYYAVRIKNGWNTPRLEATPVNGAETIVDSVSVALAGKPVDIAIVPDRVILPADGQSRETILVELRDELGLPTINGLIATVIEGDSLVTNSDEDPDQRGLQISSENGQFLVHIRPSLTTGRRNIVVESHGYRATCVVAFVPAHRSMFMSGIIEGRLGAFSSSGSGDPLGLEDYYEGVRFKGESRFFIQGTSYAGINLTARIDTDKRYDDPLLQTFNPERQYTAYGDASELHYEAPAQGGNYIALEKGQSFLRYGDFRSPFTEGEFLTYKKSATGLNGAIVSGNAGVEAFVTKTDFFTVQDEIQGDGTSGFYFLSKSPVVENSVNLMLQVRDRYQSERILEIRPLTEHRDFTVNYFNGAILFKEPIPAFTRELNPVRIVAIYEAESSEEGDYLYGIRGALAQSGRFKLGVTAIAKDGHLSDYSLYGFDGGYSIGWLDLGGEFARSEDDIAGEGNAFRVMAGTKKLMGEHSVYLRKVDGNFLNPSFAGASRELYSEKAGFDSHLRISNDLSIDSHGFKHRNDNSGDRLGNVDVLGKYEGKTLMFGAGLRAATQDKESIESSSFLTMLDAGVRAGRSAELRTHWERNQGADIVDEYPDRLTSALSYRFLQRYRVVATHEYLSAHNRPATHQLLTGIEAQTGQNSKLYTKYAMNRTANDKRMGTIMGMKQTFPITWDLAAMFDIEGYRSFSSQVDDEYVAVKTGLNRIKRGKSLVEAQYEYRWQRASNRHVLKLNAGKEFDKGMSVIFKDAISISTFDDRETSLRMDGRLAGVYRPLVTPFRSLFLLRTEYDRYSPVDPEAIVWKLIASTDINVIPHNAHELRFKLAAKRVENYSTGISETSRNYLLLSQYVFRFARNWDVDLWVRFLGQVDVGTRQIGSGAELGYLFFDRVRIGAGYSVGGFEDRDLSENDAWQKGFGIRVQLILSDWMFNDYKF